LRLEPSNEEEGRSGGAPPGWQSWDTLARIVRRRFVRGFLLAVTLCGKSASIPAAADESPGVPVPPSQPAVETGAGAAQGRGAVQLRTTQRWYGGQILLVDGITLGLLGLGAGVFASTQPGTSHDVGLGLLVAGGVGVRLGAPIVHWVHGHVGTGFGSLGLRVFVPTLLGLAVAGGDLQNKGFFVGNVIGLAAVIVLDVAVFAYDDVPVSHDAAAPQLLRVAPDIAATPQGLVAGVGGAF